jgi:hypothetical protein
MPDATAPPVTKKRNLPSGAAPFGVKVAGAQDADVLASLVANSPFPARDIRLGSVALEAGGGRDVEFPTPSGSVVFRASGSAFSSLGVYASGEAALRDLRPGEAVAPAIALPEDAEHRYVVLRWGYDLAGYVKGSLGLGAGARVRFGADGRSEGVFAVIRRLPRMTGARDALAGAVDGWAIPALVDSAEALDPGTWIVAEVDGAIAATLGAGYGYDFHWVRATELGTLTGDIGLRLEAAVQAALTFSAAGRYAVVLSRETDEPVLRLRLYRLALNGWKFAFDLKAAAQAALPAPGTADEFVNAVFGLHGAQVVRDLKALEAWASPEASPGGALAALSSHYVRRLVEALTGVNPEAEFERARARLLELIARWEALPQRVSALVWRLIEQRVNLAPVRELVARLASATDDQLREELGHLLGQLDFFRRPEGRLLEELAGRGLLAALRDTAALEQIRTGAAAVLGLLDGGAIEEVLERLQRVVEERLNLDKVRELAGKDFTQLDEWLQAKLAAFLDDKLTATRFDELRAALGELLARREEFYRAALQAVTRKFEAAVAYAYERAAESSALLDLSFDFRAPEAPAAFRRAAGGEFDELLLSRTPGVRLHLGELTHGLRRHTAVEIALPFFEKRSVALARSLAKLRVTEDGAGRLLVYELESSDTAREIVRGKMARESSLAVAGAWQAGGNQVRIHNRAPLRSTYTLRQAGNDMKTAELERLLEPLVAEYFPGRFGTAQDGAVARSFSTFLRNLDDYIEGIAHNGVNTFGDTLVALEVSVPGGVLEAWLDAPASKRDPAYLAMSVAIQAALKQVLPFCYFADRRKWLEGIYVVAPLLVWASIPPATRGKSDLYWDWPDREEQVRRATDLHTQAALLRRLEEIHRLLLERPEPEYVKRAADYRPEADVVARLTAAALKGTRVLLEGLLFVEAEIVEAARAAGLKMAEFRRARSARPAEAVRALAEFGEKLTAAFHRKLRSVYGGAALRPLGTRVMIEAARALRGEPAGRIAQADALLYLGVVREGARFMLERFIDGELPPAEELLVEQKLVRFGQAPA